MHDPMVNESYCETFGWVSKEHLARMRELSYRANDVLTQLFDDAGLIPVDFKLEFGLFNGEVVLGDEFSPDGSRLWDKTPGQDGQRPFPSKPRRPDRSL